MVQIEVSESMQWHTFDGFEVAFLCDDRATDTQIDTCSVHENEKYVAYVRCTARGKFWALDLDKYLDVLNKRKLVGYVLFDLRETDITEGNFVRIYLKYRRFWLKGLTVLDENAVRLHLLQLDKRREYNAE